MGEFFRRNKVLLQTCFLLAAFFGFDGWTSLKALTAAFNSYFDIGNTLLSSNWCIEPVVGVPFARVFLIVVVTGVTFNLIFTLRNRRRPFSILRTELNFEFHDGGARVISTRRQV